MKKRKKSVISKIRTTLDRAINATIYGFNKVMPTILLFAFIVVSLNWNFVSSLFKNNENILESVYQSDDLSEVGNEYEVVGLRTSNTKTFKKLNDSFELVVYGKEVHYKDSGEYKEIDNTLVESNDFYVNSKNRFQVELNKDANNFSKVKHKNDILEWKMNVKNNDQKGKSTEKDKNKLEHTDTFGLNTKLEYIVQNDGVKENIELSNYIKDFSFSYTIKTDLRIEKVGQELYFFNQLNEHIFTIKEYYMYDSNGNESYEIDYYINKINNKEHEITVIPSDDYLRNASYPVIIDPEIIVNNMEGYMGSIDSNLYDPMSPEYPNITYQQYPTLTKKTVNGVDKSSKMIMSILFPSESEYPGISNLKNSNFLYAYLEMPTDGNANSNPRTYCSTGTCTVNAKKINTDLKWYQLNPTIPNYTTTLLSTQSLNNGSVFRHRFDLYSYLYENVQKFGTSFQLFLELSLSGGEGSYVKYTQPRSTYDSIPQFRLGYSNDAGISNHFTYEKFPSSNSSEAYIAHNNGNLTTVYNDYTFGDLMNVSHVYNANRSHTLTDYGKGYRLNYEESIKYNHSYVTLTKGDGSEVEFMRYGTSGNYYYIAKDGSGDKITGTSGSFVLRTNDKAEKRFNSLNKLYKITPDINAPTKYVTITFNNNKITQLTDNLGNRVEFYYNSVGLLNCLFVYRKPSNVSQAAVLVQTNWYIYDYLGRLVSIEKDDRRETMYRTSETCSLSYYGDTGKLESIKDNITNGLSFTYDNANRISQVKQVVPNITNPSYLKFNYDNNGRKLTVEDVANKKTVSYTFDSEFHTKTVTDSFGYTSFNEYYDIYYPNGEYTTDPNYNMRHKIINSSQPFKNNVNLINNHSFELPNTLHYWTNASSGGSLSIQKTALYGTQALKLTKNTATDTSKVYQSIKVESGKEYILSGYIMNENSTGGAKLDISSSYITINSRSTSVVNSDGFVYYYIKFKANYTTSISVYLVNESVGSALFDMIQLNSDIIDTRYNYLQNSSFENGTTGWTSLSSSEVTLNNALFNNELMGKYSAKIINKTISQKVNISGKSGDDFVFGGYLHNSNIYYRGKITLTFTYTDGSTGTNVITFNQHDLNVQYMMYKAKASKDYMYITVSIAPETVLNYSNNVINECLTIDNLSLFKVGYGVNIDYNDKGLIESTYNQVTSTGSNYQYDEDGNVILLEKNNVTSDVEQDNGFVKSVTSNNISENYKRDTNGKVKELSISTEENGQKVYHFSASTEYSSDKQYVTKVTNEYGVSTSYIYDYLTGLLKSATTNGQTTSYNYDILKNMVSVTQTGKTITYGYEGKKLISITVDGLVFSFTYNAYGDIESIKVAGQTVINNTYNNVNDPKYSSQIGSVAYGSDIVRFTYDNEGRVKEVFLNEYKQAEYMYDSAGNIAKMIDYMENPSNPVTYFYNIDELNSLVTITASNGNNITYEYEKSGFLSKKTNVNGSVKYEYENIDNNTNENSINKVLYEEIFTNFRYQYNYKDKGLNKLESTAVVTGSAKVITSYVYDTYNKTVDGETRSYETLRIKELNITKDVNGTVSKIMKFVYTYDNFGNIAIIDRYDNNNTYSSQHEEFSYDSFNQLTSHTMFYEYGEHSTYYTYDKRGNILSIKKYSEYPDITYTAMYFEYKTSGWKDQLVKVSVDNDLFDATNSLVYYYVNGYDALGSPTNYMGYEMEYIQGRLQRFEKDNVAYEYTYNSKGIRVSKYKDANNFVNYTLEESKIIKEERTSGSYNNVLRYFYDQAGNLIGFSYDGVNYNYIKNLQNDIIAICNESGEVLVRYVYDAYGNIANIFDYSNIGLGEKNPFRYKSYYYDNETGWYYLNARFYDPTIGRFINADNVNILNETFDNVGQYNLYAYCLNNPVNMTDSSGYWPKFLKKLVRDVKETTKFIVNTAKTVVVTAAKAVEIVVETSAKIVVATGEKIVNNVVNDAEVMLGLKTVEEGMKDRIKITTNAGVKVKAALDTAWKDTKQEIWEDTLEPFAQENAATFFNVASKVRTVIEIVNYNNPVVVFSVKFRKVNAYLNYEFNKKLPKSALELKQYAITELGYDISGVTVNAITDVDVAIGYNNNKDRTSKEFARYVSARKIVECWTSLLDNKIDRQYLLGLYRIGATDISNTGCGAIAVYNALVQLNRTEEFVDIIFYFDSRNMVGNLLGIVPEDINMYLEMKNIDINYTTDTSSFTPFLNQAKGGSVSIIVYWNDPNKLSGGAHYVMFFTEYKNYQYLIKVYNESINPIDLEDYITNTTDKKNMALVTFG